MLTRRAFSALSLGLLLPSTLIAAPRISSNDRKFLFIFCDGGWDPGFVFTPLDHIAGAHVDPDSTITDVNGIRFIDHPERDPVRQFFETAGDRCAIVNGLLLQSIAHDRCRKLWLTGSHTNGDDWPALLAGSSADAAIMPHLVLDGPAYTDLYTENVVRVGDSGQLQSLLSAESSTGLSFPSAEVQALEAARLRARNDQLLGPVSGAYATALRRLETLREWEGLNLAAQFADCERDIAADCTTAFECFSQGLSRCAMVRYKGWCASGWDTHQDIAMQSLHFHDLFAYLLEIIETLDSFESAGGGSLADEVTIVVFSEMGREPTLNLWGGKDHWPYTSAMLIGSGIAGGQVLGGLDDQGRAEPIEGLYPLPDNLGATLLALGDVDPGELLGDASTIPGLIA